MILYKINFSIFTPQLYTPQHSLSKPSGLSTAGNKTANPWSSLIEGGEGSYLPNCQTTLVIALDGSLLFCIFINTTAYGLGRYKTSPPSTKELHTNLYHQVQGSTENTSVLWVIHKKILVCVLCCFNSTCKEI